MNSFIFQRLQVCAGNAKASGRADRYFVYHEYLKMKIWRINLWEGTLHVWRSGISFRIRRSRAQFYLFQFHLLGGCPQAQTYKVPSTIISSLELQITINCIPLLDPKVRDFAIHIYKEKNLIYQQDFVSRILPLFMLQVAGATMKFLKFYHTKTIAA